MLSQCRAVERVVVHRALGRNGLDEVIVSDLLVAERTVRETELQVVDGAAQRFEERLLADAVGRRERREEAETLAARETRSAVVAPVHLEQVFALVIVGRAVEPPHDSVFVAAAREVDGRARGEVEVREVFRKQPVAARFQVAEVLGFVVVAGDERQVVLIAEGLVVGAVDVGHVVVLIVDRFLVCVGEVAFGFGFDHAGIFRIFDVHAAVIVMQIALRIAEVGLDVEVLVELEFSFERGGELLDLLVAAALAFLHHGVVAVHDVVGRGVGARGVRHGRAVGVHRDERCQRMERRFAEVIVFVLIAVVFVIGLEELGVARDGQPRPELGGQLRAEVVRLVHVGQQFVDTLLLVVTAADHVRKRLAATLDVDVVIPGRAGVVVEVVVPVEVGQVDVLLLAVAAVGDDPGPRRILLFVVAALP